MTADPAEYPLEEAPVPEAGKRRRLYLAGPFFNITDRWLVNETRTALMDQGMDVFSPMHDVGLGPAHSVVPADIQAIRDCDAMLCLLCTLDPGTVFEAGFARSLGKPVVVFAQNVGDEAVKMLAGTDCDICGDFASSIYKAVWAANG
jgi:nucleoside 2-deoxyribosyltransferase